MTMDHGTCNIDVGCSINIQRTDGEWTAREYPSGFIIVQASARRRRPRSGPAPSRSGADSFILPRISVFPLAFLSSATSLHPRFRIYRSLLFSWNPQVLRLSLSLSRSLCKGPFARVFQFGRFFSFRLSLSLSLLLRSVLYLTVPDDSYSWSLHCLIRSFSLSLLCRLSGPARASPCFSVAACHAAGRAEARFLTDRAWAPDRSFDRSIDRPAGLHARTCVPIYGKFRARPFFRGSREFSPSRHICFPFFFSPRFLLAVLCGAFSSPLAP